MVRVMVKQSEQYGPVVGLFMVSKPFVCVTGYEAVRDVMLNPDLMGRPNSFVFRLRTKNDRFPGCRIRLHNFSELFFEQKKIPVHIFFDVRAEFSGLAGF